MTSVPSFDDYLEALSPFVPQAAGAEPEALALCERATAKITGLNHLDREGLASALAADPHIAPVLAAVAGLSQERFKTWLKNRFATAGWITLSKKRSAELIAAFDEDFELLSVLAEQAARTWTWSDVLARTMAPRQSAGGWVQQGRDLEDAVEEVIEGLGLSYVPRTRFTGRGGQTAPADFAIPDGEHASIAVAVKGFDSTGSKLTDASREIEQMGEVRLPSQYIFAVVDGQGWRRRQNDLRRIYGYWQNRSIDGMYTRSQLQQFESALTDAAHRARLLD